jgi:hypothetical protein
MNELWNWRVDGRVTLAEVHAALADVFGTRVVPLGRVNPEQYPAEAMICDVWHVDGAFPTGVDCYAPPSGAVEIRSIAALARRLERGCLLPDDTLDPGRFLLVAPDGTTRPVHLDVWDTEHGEVLGDPRPCTRVDLRCRGWAPCRQSRWAPDSVLPALAAA